MIDEIFNDILTQIRLDSDQQDQSIIIKAFEFAKEAHKGQKRHSKEDYITHPLAVAKILVDLKQDEKVIAAALLHDTIEDCDVTDEDIEQSFDTEIAQLVKGVTNLGKIYFESKEEKQAENFRRMFIAMAKDIRVLIIKLADRLHNMRTLDHLPLHRKIKISVETMDIFAPLAHRLGMASFKWELEDLAFYYLQHSEYQEIKDAVAITRDDRESYIILIEEKIKDWLKNSNIKARVTGRPKHFYSIYKKLIEQNIEFDELLDKYGIRIIVDDSVKCYQTLGLVHSIYKPMEGRFKDYIAVPKLNGYQSLHTTVIGEKGKPVEIQIRSEEMHQISEYGIAAHWQYKNNQSSSKQPDPDFSWLRQIVDYQQSEKIEAKEFFSNLKLDLFMDEVFVYTPNGDLIKLPKESTPLDFAYKVHTEIGDHFRGAKVNGIIMPMQYQLKSGDRVEILTSRTSVPKVHWLDYTKTHHAKSNIRQFLKKKQKEESIKLGYEKINQYIAHNQLSKALFFSTNYLAKLQKKFHIKSFEECAIKISQGEITLHAIDLELFPEKKETMVSKTKIKRSSNSKKSASVLIVGLDSIDTKSGKCCKPLPGEEIKGYITKGAGVTIHRMDCKSLHYLSSKEPHRIIDAEWNVNQTGATNESVLQIIAWNRVGVLDEILQRLVELKININEIHTITINEKSLMKSTVHVDLKDLHQFNILKNKLLLMSDIVSIKRQ